ncbi:MAG TPA: hypothetical protein PLC42_07160 [Parachlamydiaceae bacterium]|nr:hypothetical protein [Parachlamydiaceae bacterium]
MYLNTNLINDFQKLNHESQQAFYHDLSFKDRGLFLKIIEKNGHIKLSESDSKTLSDKLGKIKEMPLSSKSNATQSGLLKNISSFIDNVAYFFHFLTADKLDQLVAKHFQETWKKELIDDILQDADTLEILLSDQNRTLIKEKEFLLNELANNKDLVEQIINKHPHYKNTTPDFILEIQKQKK